MALPSLLNWGLEHSDPQKLAEEAEAVRTGQKAPTQVDKKWMNIILKSDAEKMKDAIKTFTDTQKDLSERVEALEELQDLVETIDNANDLPKIGGLVPVIQALNDPAPEIQMYAAWVLGTCAQNNTESQEKILENGGLPVLVGVLGNTKSPNVRGKVLNAISAMIRSNVKAMEQFRRLDGFATILKVLETDDEQSKRRLVHVLTQLAVTFPFVKEVVRETGLFQALVEMVKIDDLDLREKCLAALIMFLENSAQNKHEFKQRKVPQQLQAIRQTIENTEDNSEIHYLLNKLITMLN